MKSQNPISLVQNGVTQIYDSWRVSKIYAVPRPQGARVILNFQLCGLAQDNVTLLDYPGPAISYIIPNILTDSNLNIQAAALFNAVMNEALGAGVIV